MKRLILAALCTTLLIGANTYAQPGSSDFDPRTELNKLKNSPRGYQRVRNLFYLGDLTSRSDDKDVAREAFRQAVLTYRELEGNHQRLAVPWAAQSMLGLAGLSHLEFRDMLLRWSRYAEDSTARWDMMTAARNEYNGVVDLEYARASFEALYLRAHLLEEWDEGRLDGRAESEPGLRPLERAITHLNVSHQLVDQAHDEYERLAMLEDSLGLAGGDGDEDVSRWVALARERLDVMGGSRDSLVAREEALQALYAERKCGVWIEKAVPRLWERADEVAGERDAGDADPWLDYWLQYQLVNEAFRPFLFGETGFYTRHQKSANAAKLVRDTEWLNERLKWQRRQEWLDAEIARKLAWAGIGEMRRLPDTFNTIVERLAVQADSLSPEWQQALRGMPPQPDADMPPIPTFGGRDPRMAYGEDRAEMQGEYDQFLQRMSDLWGSARAYQDSVAAFVTVADVVTSEDIPAEMSEYLRLRRGLTAAQVLLLDSLKTRVVDQVTLGLNKSRDAAVWMILGVASVNAQQSIRDYRTAAAAALREIAAEAASEADRYEAEAEKLNRAAPAASMEMLAERFDAYAADLRTEADRLSPAAQASAGP